MTTSAPSRRDVLALAATAASFAAAPAMADATSLKTVAKTAGVLFGTGIGPEVFTDVAYRDLVLAQCAIVTPMNALKFDWLQPAKGRYVFAAADRIVDAARERGLLVRGHNLFWNDWPPAWLSSLSSDEVARVFDAHLDNVVPHFAGRLHSWDVVNEPFWLGKDKPGTFRPGAWFDALGPDYVSKAFARAAVLDPHAKLVLNEAWTERADSVGIAVRRSLLKLIDQIQDRGIKLDAIGLESHLFPAVAWDAGSFADFLHAIGERHLDIYITELDVEDASFPAQAAACDADVARWTSSFLATALAVPAVKIVQTWGLSDRYSWYRDPRPMQAAGYDRLPRPLPYDDSLAEKPMRRAMMAAFRDRPAAARG